MDCGFPPNPPTPTSSTSPLVLKVRHSLMTNAAGGMTTRVVTLAWGCQKTQSSLNRQIAGRMTHSQTTLGLHSSATTMSCL